MQLLLLQLAVVLCGPGPLPSRQLNGTGLRSKISLPPHPLTLFAGNFVQATKRVEQTCLAQSSHILGGLQLAGGFCQVPSSLLAALLQHGQRGRRCLLVLACQLLFQEPACRPSGSSVSGLGNYSSGLRPCTGGDEPRPCLTLSTAVAQQQEHVLYTPRKLWEWGTQSEAACSSCPSWLCILTIAQMST